MNNLSAALMAGIDIPFEEACLVIHQPSLLEISYCGELNFFTGLQLLTINKNVYMSQDEFNLKDQSEFQIFMMLMQQSEIKPQKEKVIDFLQLIFPQENIIFTPRAIVIGNSNIDEDNFSIFQNLLKTIFCTNNYSQQLGFNPKGNKATEIAEKLQKARERIAKQKQAESGDDGLIAHYASMLSVGLQLPIHSIFNYTLFQLLDAVERYTLWLNWDLDIKVKLAGGNSDKQPDNWMKNLH